jgi:hypothetical protein
MVKSKTMKKKWESWFLLGTKALVVQYEAKCYGFSEIDNCSEVNQGVYCAILFWAFWWENTLLSFVYYSRFKL